MDVPESRPWYRQLWPWLIIAIPLLGVVMSTITAVAAIHGADAEVRVVEAPLSKTSWQREDLERE